MRKYSVIFWDLDQTLLNFDLSMEHALRAVFHKYGLDIDDRIIVRYDAINKSYWNKLELGEITKEEVTVGRFRTLFEEFNIQHISPEEINRVFQKELGSVYFYMDGAKETVQKLREMGYRQYVVTNGVNSTQASKMKLSGFDRMVDGVFVSEVIGYPKPMKAFYEACFSALPDVKRDECIMVGDSLTSDMRGANNAGIAACWFNPNACKNDTDVQTNYEIRQLTELLTILEEERV